MYGGQAHRQNLVKSCMTCQEVQKVSELAPLHPWMWPCRLWDWVHLDFAGTYLSKSFLIVVNTYSKRPEIEEMLSTSAAQTIIVLQCIITVTFF